MLVYNFDESWGIIAAMFLLPEKSPNVTISGSFKFKREIDLAIEEFKDRGVRVLAPARGGILTAEGGFGFLAGETGIKRTEDDFLVKIIRSHGHYLVTPGGYFGESTAMELGFSVTAGKVVAVSEVIRSEEIIRGTPQDSMVRSLDIRTVREFAEEIKAAFEENPTPLAGKLPLPGFLRKIYLSQIRGEELGRF